jgi:hypothetical protein
MAERFGEDAERNNRLVVTVPVNEVRQRFLAIMPDFVWRLIRSTRPRDCRARTDPKGMASVPRPIYS